MTIWPSRTKAWNGKTNPVNLQPAVKTLKDEEDDFMDEIDEIAKLKSKVEALELELKDKKCEIVRLLTKLDENTDFLQGVVMELIKLKSMPRTASDAIALPGPKTKLEEYIARKNANAVEKK